MNKNRAIKDKSSKIDIWGTVYYIAMFVIMIGILMGQQTNGAPRVISGYSIFYVLTSSMQSEIPKESLVITKATEAKNLQIGDDITFMVGPSTSITHRIVGIVEDYKGSEERGFETKGLENSNKDSEIVPASNVVGKVIYHNYYLGKIAGYITSYWHLILLYLVLYFFLKRGIMSLMDRTDILHQCEISREVKELTERRDCKRYIMKNLQRSNMNSTFSMKKSKEKYKITKEVITIIIRKLIAIVLASVLASAIITSGTFAWQSISQEATNKTMGAKLNPGGRLHIDAYFEDMNIYVENFTDPSDGTPIYARVRLSEYMEIGEEAGEKEESLRTPEIEVQGRLGADINDTSTWDTIYMTGNGQLSGIDGIRSYFQIGIGGQGIYMPTFNKNKDSHLGDINGTLAGPDTIDKELEDAYTDYIRYTLDSSDGGVTEVTDIARYDADEDDIEEDDPIIATPAVPVEDADVYDVEETHYSANTGVAKVISMADWKRLPANEQVGSYWVYDTDGWAYWAQAIMPGTATGLLLDCIIPVNTIEDSWYYEIHGYGEYATAGDWGVAEEETGFYQIGITGDGLALLDTVSGNK